MKSSMLRSSSRVQAVSPYINPPLEDLFWIPILSLDLLMRLYRGGSVESVIVLAPSPTGLLLDPLRDYANFLPEYFFLTASIWSFFSLAIRASSSLLKISLFKSCYLLSLERLETLVLFEIIEPTHDLVSEGTCKGGLPDGGFVGSFFGGSLFVPPLCI